MNLRPLLNLAEDWREDAEWLRDYGAEGQAQACEKHAEALEDRLREWELEMLTLEQAAEETGLAYDTAQRKVSSGEWPNRGEKGRPRVRRCDVLPGLQAPEPREVEEPVEELARETLQARAGAG